MGTHRFTCCSVWTAALVNRVRKKKNDFKLDLQYVLKIRSLKGIKILKKYRLHIQSKFEDLI